jgi:N-acetylmuramoyl-L-alanine amidase
MRKLMLILCVTLVSVFLLSGFAYAAAVYTVKSGDSLWKIGQTFGVDYRQIAADNRLAGYVIYPGQQLYIGQSTAVFSQQDIELMARVVYAEARGESYTGQVAVAAVILNRLESSQFPNTLQGVVYQPWAFEVVSNGQLWLNPNDTAYRAAQDAIKGWDPSYGAVFFWNPAIARNSWLWSRPITIRIGNHIFAR